MSSHQYEEYKYYEADGFLYKADINNLEGMNNPKEVNGQLIKNIPNCRIESMNEWEAVISESTHSSRQFPTQLLPHFRL